MSLIQDPIIKADMKDIFLRNNLWKEFNHCTILITGAYGMIASYLTLFFIWLNEEKQQNVRIIAAVRNEEKAKKFFDDILGKKYFQLYLDDINKEFICEQKIDYIFHAAGISNPQIYSTHPTEVAKTNVISTYYLLNWAISHPIKGFLLFSSGDIYGKMQMKEDEIYENDMGVVNPLDLHSCYSESKRMAETWCMSFEKEYRIRAMSVRICHTYGTLMDLENDPRVFSSFIKDAIEERDINVKSDGSARRPFCYITDAISAFLIIMIKGKAGESYNLSNNSEFLSIKELAEIISELTNGKSKVIITNFRNDRYLENNSNHENRPIEKKLMDLGWDHTIDSREGFKRVLDYNRTIREKLINEKSKYYSSNI